MESNEENDPTSSRSMPGCLSLLGFISFFLGTFIKAYIVSPTINEATNDTFLGSIILPYIPNGLYADVIANIRIYGIFVTYKAATIYWGLNWFISVLLSLSAIGMPVSILILGGIASGLIERSSKSSNDP
jgi:hypothetical protein